jgi:hypothetical protein
MAHDLFNVLTSTSHYSSDRAEEVDPYHPPSSYYSPATDLLVRESRRFKKVTLRDLHAEEPKKQEDESVDVAEAEAPRRKVKNRPVSPDPPTACDSSSSLSALSQIRTNPYPPINFSFPFEPDPAMKPLLHSFSYRPVTPMLPEFRQRVLKIMEEFWSQDDSEDDEFGSLETTQRPSEEKEYWMQVAQRSDEWNVFSQFARAFLTGLASEASCERLFSRMRRVLGEHRFNLVVSTLFALCFLIL